MMMLMIDLIIISNKRQSVQCLFALVTFVVVFLRWQSLIFCVFAYVSLFFLNVLLLEWEPYMVVVEMLMAMIMVTMTWVVVVVEMMMVGGGGKKRKKRKKTHDDHQ